MTARDKLAMVVSPALLEILDQYVAEKVDERLGARSAGRMAARQRPEFLNVQEAAELLRCDRQRVYDLVSSGRLTRLKNGTRVLVRRAEIEAHLNGGTS